MYKCVFVCVCGCGCGCWCVDVDEVMGGHVQGRFCSERPWVDFDSKSRGATLDESLPYPFLSKLASYDASVMDLELGTIRSHGPRGTYQKAQVCLR